MAIISKENVLKLSENILKIVKYRFLDKLKLNVLQDTLVVKEIKQKSTNHITRYKHDTGVAVTNTASIFGRPDAIVNANTHVSRITVATTGYKIGEIVENVNVAVVKTADDTIKDVLVTNGHGIVVGHDGSYFSSSLNVVEIEINKQFDENVYFIVGLGKVGNNRGQAGYATSTRRVAFDKTGDLQVGDSMTPHIKTSSGRGNGMIIYSADTPFTSGASGTVISVNGESPDSTGNVTIGMTHINGLLNELDSKAEQTDVEQLQTKVSDLELKKLDKYSPAHLPDVTVDSLKLTNQPIKQAVSNSGTGLSGNRTFAGFKDASVQAGTNITNIHLGVWGYNAGETATGVSVYAVRKDNDTIIDELMSEASAVVHTIANASRSYNVVDIPVNKSYTDEVYFIARLRQVTGGKGMHLGGSVTNGIAFDKDSVSVGEIIISASNRIPNMFIYGDGVDLRKSFVNVSFGGFGTGQSMELKFLHADGTEKTIDLAGSAVPYTAKAGEIRAFAYDLSQVNPITRNVDDVVDTEEDGEEENNTRQEIQGDKTLIDNQHWVKLEGQTYQMSNGQTITLPTSTDGNYLFMCLG